MKTPMNEPITIFKKQFNFLSIAVPPSKLEVINIFANIPYLLTVHHTHKLGGHNCP